MTTSGGLGEAEGGGPSLNILPKEGGNTVRGTFYAGRCDRGHGRQQLLGRAARARAHDSGRDPQGVGLQPRRRRPDHAGPDVVLTPRFAMRAANAAFPACLPTRMPAIPTKWTYVADTSRPAVLAASYRIATARLTTQATPRHKFSLFWDEQQPCEGGAAPGFTWQRLPHVGRRRGLRRVDRRADTVGLGHCSRRRRPPTAITACASVRRSGRAPVTNRLLFEAGMGIYRSRYGGKQMPGLEHREPDSRRRAVRHRMRGERQHSRADVSLRQLVVQHQLEQPVERGGLIRHRQPQHQGRIPGRTADRRAQELHELGVPVVSRPERRAGSVDDEHQPVPRSGSASASMRSTRRNSGRAAASRCRARCATTTRGATSPNSRSGRCASSRRR